MKCGKVRIGGLYGFAAVAMAAGIAAPAVHAQQATPTPTPAPARPQVFTLPNVTPERFTLGTPAATPTPTPAPVPTPAPAPPPVAASTAPPALPRSVPRTAATPAAAAPTPVPTAVPTAAATESPAAAPTPVAAATPAPVPAVQPAAQPSASGMPGWLWALLGAGATALAFGGVWALQRRRAGSHEAEAFEPVAAPPPPAPARPVAPPPGIAPKAPVVPAPPIPSGEPFEVVLRPSRVEVTERDVVLDFELLLGNTQPAAAENIRVAMAMISASPDQDRHVAGYHASPMVDPAIAPFDLAAGAGGRMPVRLALPRELIHIVQVQGRPMFVPLVMVELKWRAGLGIRRFGADFMVGIAGQGAKLGPIWLDRNQQASQLAANRYLPRQAAAA